MGMTGKAGLATVFVAAVAASTAVAQGTGDAPVTGAQVMQQLTGAGALEDLPSRKDALADADKQQKRAVEAIGDSGLPVFLERSLFGTIAMGSFVQQAQDALQDGRDRALGGSIIGAIGTFGQIQNAMIAQQIRNETQIQQIASHLGADGGGGGAGGWLFGNGGAGGQGGAGGSGGLFGSGGSGGAGGTTPIGSGGAGGNAGGPLGQGGDGGQGGVPGPQGPAGPQGPQGAQGPPGPAASALWARVSDDPPALVAGRGVVSVAPEPIVSRVASADAAVDESTVRVTFDRSVATCAATATPSGAVPAIATATPDGSSVVVRLWDGEGQSIGVPFSLALSCP